MRVEIYTKPGCPLCEDALELLEEASHQLPLEVTKIDIYGDAVLFERYRYRVPVVRVHDRDVLELNFTLEKLLEALRP